MLRHRKQKGETNFCCNGNSPNVYSYINYILDKHKRYTNDRGIRKGKDLIIFLFVPINAILTLPLFAKSFSKFRDGRIDGKILRNRGVLLIILLAIILIFECIYFKNIQQQVVNMITEEERQTVEQQQTYLNSVAANTLAAGENAIDSTNSVDDENVVNVNDINNQEESNIVTNSVQ